MGLISTLIIARLLVPEDFGVLAISMLLIAMIEMLTVTGSSQYIQQKKDVSEQDLNSAWTLNIVLKLSIACVVFYLAPFAAYFYQDSRLIWTIQILSSLMVLNALINPGIMALERDINYKKIVFIDIFNKVISVATTIILALVYRDYTALVYGHIASCLSSLFFSYILIAYRPKFSLENIKEQWGFSRYALLQGMLGFFRAHIDTLIVSRFFPMHILGTYNTIKYISLMPSSEIITPALKPMIATFAKKSNNLGDLRHQFALSVLILSMLILPIVAFSHVYHYEFVSILLGNNWLEYSYVFKYLVLMTITTSFSVISGQMLIACGQIKHAVKFNVISTVLLMITLILIYQRSFEEFLIVRVAFEMIVATIFFLLTNIFLLKSNPFKYVFSILINFICLYFFANFLHDYFVLASGVVVSVIVNGLLFLLGAVAINFAVFRLLWRNSVEGQHFLFILKSNVNNFLITLKIKN